MATTTKTPGYNTRLAVSFHTDKLGRRYAQYFSHAAFRYIRVSATSADLWIAQDLADRA